MMQQQGQLKPTILKESQGASEETGENARISKFVGATAVSDLIKTTLGPKGMDKILQSIDENGIPSKKVTVTNDGATILKSVNLDNAAAKVLVEISKTQDDDVGDGTTSVVVLAGELLKRAEQLIAQKVHPQIIMRGWRLAYNQAKSTLKNSAVLYKNK
ncbi:T-complex protein 1 subunit beta, partial [Bonamia ostreae]